MSLGGKYIWKPDENPPVGAYNYDAAFNHTKSKSVAAVIKGPVSPYRRPKDSDPDPGQYNASTHKDWEIKPMTMGTKYKWKPDSNPPVGGYDVNMS